MESSALSQFVILAQANQGRACEALVRDALDHSGVFVYGELLDCPTVQALRGSPDGQKLLELLQIFSYGTYPDYKAKAGELPELSAAQKRKLQLLTIVTLATKDKLIKFTELQTALDVSNPRELEDLIIEAVYQNLIVGKMDQENRCLIVESCACRDVRDQDIDFIIETLTSWHGTAHQMLKSLDGMVQHSHDSYEKSKLSREELEKQVQSTRDSLKEGETSRSGGWQGRH